MAYPGSWEKYLDEYSFADTKHVYTNGSELIQSFRVRQMMDHYAGNLKELNDTKEACEFWYQEYYSLYFRLASLKDKLNSAINSDDIISAKDIYGDLFLLLEFHYEPPKENSNDI